ncbi:hypothetical protein BIFPSEUDO_03876 [Bifidobacterium pseudocatenulatum DSM 20438 = JCM 1200 = LMG 10505]|uniref:Uncharacterized protein n=1 Tax=Bifidobacterium pseudocatenulatum DSM 20438 = JCM 1200 = LMG 10505 TaxID=547043 RepID=C0BTZ5_BIFPS|nr:hypothetical protein BIFPSEUDO_03876 [Bifidobacterium pseudocatenulatum DSM 20438 = JCM 1200 = LMG 10505]
MIPAIRHHIPSASHAGYCPPCSIYPCTQKQRPRHRYVYFK